MRVHLRKIKRQSDPDGSSVGSDARKYRADRQLFKRGCSRLEYRLHYRATLTTANRVNYQHQRLTADSSTVNYYETVALGDEKKLEDTTQTSPSSSSHPDEGSNMECSESTNSKYVCSICRSRPLAIKIEESTTTTTTTREEIIEEESYESSFLRYYNDDNSTVRRVPFPEAGVDIVDRKLKNTEDAFEREINKEHDDDILTYTESWTENWLFRKKNDQKSNKRNDDEKSFKPVSMFVPMTSAKYRAMIGDRDVDEISDLSDCDDSLDEDKFADDDNEDEKRRRNKVHSKYIYDRDARLLLDSKSKHHRSEHYGTKISNNNSEIFDSTIGNSDRSYRSELFIETSNGVNQNSVPAVTDDDNKLLSDIDFNLFSPPKPGTIADREHRKWQTAVPMENNPYSEANLQRRLLERKYNPTKYSSLLGMTGVRINGFDDGVAVDAKISDIDFETIDLPENSKKESIAKEEEEEIDESKNKSCKSKCMSNNRQIIKLTKKNSTTTTTINEVDYEEEEEKISLPSVKKLVEVFSAYQRAKGFVQLPPIPSPRKSKDKNNTSEEMKFVRVERTSRPPHLHSLTARSLSKEFREGLR